ncbi:MAG: GTPase HflX [Gracilimonas sp.]|uniref:GTPase HflX n=1 Tax=Gracilimonas sp. TaxID=1974203 RepID=UPI001B280A2C|nr:GTPase HflX [Gracilimonas sp.]MBO6587405.1 GTPase HflX [Gracilimonas sp.]MBO6614109.1 GTPase HflX [Gracilimonas sp.]
MLDDVKNSDIERERVVLVGLYGPETTRFQAEEYLDELELLADTAGGITVEKVLQNKTHPDPSTYVGKGKLSELKRIMGEERIDTVIFDDDLSPTQIRNVEKGTDAKVLDRSSLILDIFAARAKTAAAKTQVELAQLEYLLPRLTRYWTHLSRQKGGIGTKGPGETQIETDRRLIGRRISVLKDKLEKLSKQRTTQRKGREGMNRVSLVGYTNAGKSTLMNALTETGVFAEDRLFATLDSTVRRHELENHSVLLSDTVGFIRKLPHNLVESFKSTLDEVREADILLHVVDASSKMAQEYIEVVEETLEEIEATNKKTILVFNKVDKMDANQVADMKRMYPNAVFVSAEQRIGLKELENSIEEMIELDYSRHTLQIPVSKYKAVAFIHENANVEEETYDGTDVELTFSIAKKDFKQLSHLLDTIGANGEVV